MGSVPIVETSGLDSLYNKFPCIIVESFDQINIDLLNNYIHDNEKLNNIEQYLIIGNLNEIIDLKKSVSYQTNINILCDNIRYSS
jgi:hypothetical protein